MPPFQASDLLCLPLEWLKRHPVSVYACTTLAALPIASVATYWAYEKIRDFRLRPQFDSAGLTRPLSRIETYYSTRNLANLKPNFCVSVQLSGVVWTPDEARKFAKVAMIRHAPSLCTLVDDDLPEVRPVWKRLWHPSYTEDQQGIIDIRFEERLTTSEDDKTWQKVAEAIEHEGFQFAPRDPRMSLFRIAIVSHPESTHWDIVLLPHHAVMDLHGAVEFLKVMFSAAAEDREAATPSHEIDLRLVNIEGARSVSNKKPIPWPKSFDDLWNTSLGIKLWSKSILPYFCPLVRKIVPWYYKQTSSKAWMGPVDRGTPLEPTAITTNFKIPADILDALYRNAKQNSTSINSALWGASLYALHLTHRQLKSSTDETQSGVVEPSDASQGNFSDSPSHYYSKPSGRLTARAQVPTNFRPRAKSSQEDNWSTIVTASNPEWSIDLDDEFWSKCRMIGKTSADLSHSAIKNFGSIPHIPRPSVPWLLAMSMQGYNRCQLTMGLSNGGRLNIKRSIEGSDKKLRLRDTWFTRYGATDGQLLGMTVITPAEGGDLNVNLTGAEELLPKPTLKLFQDAFVAVLDYAAKNSDSFSYGKFEFEAGSHLLAA